MNEELKNFCTSGKLVCGATTAAGLLGVTTNTLAKLIKPCSYKKSPYKSGLYIGLYDPAELLLISEQESFLEIRKKYIKRSASAQKAVKTKRKEIVDWISSLVITFDVPENMSLVKLAKLAIETRNDVSICYPDGNLRNDFQKAFYVPGCEKEEITKRWMVNYLRHCATNYEFILEQKTGKVGFSEMYSILKNKINIMAEKYINELPK